MRLFWCRPSTVPTTEPCSLRLSITVPARSRGFVLRGRKRPSQEKPVLRCDFDRLADEFSLRHLETRRYRAL
jgi:hypothetical protein